MPNVSLLALKMQTTAENVLCKRCLLRKQSDLTSQKTENSFFLTKRIEMHFKVILKKKEKKMSAVLVEVKSQKKLNHVKLCQVCVQQNEMALSISILLKMRNMKLQKGKQA